MSKFGGHLFTSIRYTAEVRYAAGPLKVRVFCGTRIEYLHLLTPPSSTIDMKIHSNSHLSQLTKGKCTHAMPCHAVLRPYRSESDFSRPRHSTAWARHGICELTSAVERRSLGDLASFGYFRLPCGIPRRLSSESQNEMQLASVKPNNVCHGRS